MDQRTFKLYRGKELLGIITHTDNDFPWYWGTFEPTEHFLTVKSLFDLEHKLLDLNDIQKHQKIWEEITKPGLRLVSNQDHQEITEFLIHIDGNETWWRC